MTDCTMEDFDCLPPSFRRWSNVVRVFTIFLLYVKESIILDFGRRENIVTSLYNNCYLLSRCVK